MKTKTILLMSILLSTAVAQSDPEIIILSEVQRLVGFIDQFQQISQDVNDTDFKIAAGVAHSVARSVNITMNAYHLIHIQAMITGTEDKQAVSSYVMKQLPGLSRLMKIESRLTEEMIEQCRNEKVLNKSKEYLHSLLTITSTLDSI
ncbi:MAG: hypothetical protein Kow0098_19340 [Ignavibacteriaceae bacterium]